MSLKHPTVREFLANPSTEVERNFFARIYLPNKTFKTTSSNRFKDLNSFSLEYIAGFKRPAIMDVAVSSGISTSEWTGFLQQHGIDFEMTATDLINEAIICSLTDSLEFLVDKDGRLLHIDLWGFGFSSDLRLHLGNAHLLPLKLSAVAVFKLTRKFIRNGKQISLQAAGLHIVNDDLLLANPAEWQGKFHVIRAANILNKVYFDSTQLRTMLNNLHARLKEDGILIVSRTDDCGNNNATIFRKKDHHFQPIARLGHGSEIEQLIAGQAGPQKIS